MGAKLSNLSKKPQLLAKSTTNACSAIWRPKLELMQVKIEIEEKVEEKFRKNWKKVEKKLRKVEEEKLTNFVLFLKTMPEAQRTQGIKSKTWIMFLSEIYLKSF